MTVLPPLPSSTALPAHRRRLLQTGVAGVLTTTLPTARLPAQMRIEVSGVGATSVPVAVADFAIEGRVPLNLVEVIRSDLGRSGVFRLIDPGPSLSDTATPAYADLRARGADAIAGGRVSRLADGRYDIRFRLHDVVRGQVLGGEAFIAPEADLRYTAHRIADWIHEKLTGERGIYATRILYVSRQGNRHRLHIADWDGENAVTPLSSPEPIMSPVWAPDGGRIAYVSFESQKPVVYVHTLSTGQRLAVANFRGSNSAPGWSPDGRVLAVSLTREGLSQIFLISADGSGGPRRLTTSSAIDTEPAFSPDGRGIYFTSDRGGAPQIYRMSVEGGEPTRVTFGSNYNVSARPSPDGRTLAFISRRDGRYLVATKNLGTGEERPLSEGGQEESPSFSPNGRWIMFATRSGGRDSLMAVSTDGRLKLRLTANVGDMREPSWGPFTK